MSDLLPCPFCAGKNLFVTTNQSGGFCLTCKSCDAVGPPAEYEPEQMREAWNTRAAIAALESMDKPRVKKLAWVRCEGETAFVALTSVKTYRLKWVPDFHVWTLDGRPYENVSIAKAAAQADYEVHILAALE